MTSRHKIYSANRNEPDFVLPMEPAKRKDLTGFPFSVGCRYFMAWGECQAMPGMVAWGRYGRGGCRIPNGRAS